MTTQDSTKATLCEHVAQLLAQGGTVSAEDAGELADESLDHPADMSRDAFLMLTKIDEEMMLARASGRDEIEGFDEKHSMVEALLSAAPWTLHPDHGCISKALAEIRNDSAWSEYGTSGRRVHLSAAEWDALVATSDPALTALAERLKQDVITDQMRDVFVLAKGYSREGELEFDEDAVVSEGDDNGAYVGGYCWVSFSGTPLCKEAEEEAILERERPRG